MGGGEVRGTIWIAKALKTMRRRRTVVAEPESSTLASLINIPSNEEERFAFRTAKFLLGSLFLLLLPSHPPPHFLLSLSSIICPYLAFS